MISVGNLNPDELYRTRFLETSLKSVADEALLLEFALRSAMTRQLGQSSKSDKDCNKKAVNSCSQRLSFKMDERKNYP